MLLTNAQQTQLEELRLRSPNAAGNYSHVYALIYSWIAVEVGFKYTDCFVG